MLHGEHRRRTVSAAASRPTDASRRRGQGGTRRCHRSSQPLETLFVRRIDEPISWSTAKIALASSPRPYAVDVTIRRVLRGCANKRTQNTAGPTPVRGPRGSVASGTLTALDAGARRVGIPQTTGPVELRATASTAERGQVFARPVDDLWSSGASRDWYGVAAAPRDPALRCGGCTARRTRRGRRSDGVEAKVSAPVVRRSYFGAWRRRCPSMRTARRGDVKLSHSNLSQRS